MLNNPLKYTDLSGEFIFLALGVGLVGAYIGAGIVAGKENNIRGDFDWNPLDGSWKGTKAWKGAVVGGIVGISVGLISASILGIAGVHTASGMGVTKGFAIASKSFTTGAINIGLKGYGGASIDEIYKSGLTQTLYGGLFAVGVASGLSAPLSGSIAGLLEGGVKGLIEVKQENLNGKKRNNRLLYSSTKGLVFGYLMGKIYANPGISTGEFSFSNNGNGLLNNRSLRIDAIDGPLSNFAVSYTASSMHNNLIFDYFVDSIVERIKANK